MGNYDTTQGSAGAFIYNVACKSYTPLSGPGAVVTTAYGIYGDKVQIRRHHCPIVADMCFKYHAARRFTFQARLSLKFNISG